MPRFRTQARAGHPSAEGHMSIEFDGLSFQSPEARAYYINMSESERAKWREAHSDKARSNTTVPAEAPRIHAPPIQVQHDEIKTEEASPQPISALPPREREE